MWVKNKHGLRFPRFCNVVSIPEMIFAIYFIYFLYEFLIIYNLCVIQTKEERVNYKGVFRGQSKRVILATIVTVMAALETLKVT